jgi:predicted nucleic acid-binding protein
VVEIIPNWLEVRRAPEPVEALGVDRGAAEAIALARVLGVPALLDDRRGRSAARSIGVSVIGTVGVLDQAAGLGLINFELTLKLLVEKTNFRLSAIDLDALIRAHKDPGGD